MCLSPCNPQPTSDSFLLFCPRILYSFLAPTLPSEFSFDIMFFQGHPYYTPLHSMFGALDRGPIICCIFPIRELIDDTVDVIAI